MIVTGNPQAQFMDFISQSGIKPPSHIIEGGDKPNRFKSADEHNDKSGWYMFYGDGIPAGVFGDWREGTTITWRMDIGRQFSDEEQREHKKKVEKMHRLRLEALRKAQDGAAENARCIWRDSSIAPNDSPYLARKMIGNHGARLRKSDGALLIPMYDSGFNLRNIEQISEDGFKWGLSDGARSGLFYNLGPFTDCETIYICEGFSTGCSIRQATGGNVVIAFNAGNLVNVAKAIRTSNRSAEIVICGDDDRANKVNIGAVKAEQASKSVDGRFVLPDFGENPASELTDFNDLFVTRGHEEVKRQLSQTPVADGVSDWTKKYQVTDEAMEKISDPTWVYENLIIHGHVVAIVAAPNGGKTTIMLQVAADMARDDYAVIYVNADVNPSDAKSMKSLADESGFALLLPDLADGNYTMADVVSDLRKLAESGADLSKQVIIFDTLKKMTDVINKTLSKELYRLFRSLSGRGMSIVLLGHTNKYKDAEGRPMYEGTGDLRADVDELIYLTGERRPGEKNMLISTNPDKVRGTFEPITFNIDEELNVTRTGYVDVAETDRQMKKYSSDRDAIEVIIGVLAHGNPMTQSEVVKAALAEGISRNKTRKVLGAYSSSQSYRHHWDKEIGFSNNSIHYRRIKGTIVSEDKTSAPH